MPSDAKITNEQYIEAAKRIYHRDGEIEVDLVSPAPGVRVSRNDAGEDGTYVLAWVWVDNDEATGAGDQELG